MNNTTPGNASLPPSSNPFLTDEATIPSPFSVIFYLPLNIYILQLIISRQWITSEYFTFNEAIMEIFICFYDILGITSCIVSNSYLVLIKEFFLGFLTTGRPFILSLICVERYLAIVKPVVYMKLKPLKYKLGLTGMVWLMTLASCSSRLHMTEESRHLIILQFISFCATKLYCCIASLRVLKRPGPGEGSRQREGMSSVKLKAFKVILVITLSVFFFYIPMVLGVLFRDYMAEGTFMIFIHVCYQCTSFTGAIHALLFLQRCGKLPFITCL